MDENGLPANPNFFRIHDTGDIGWLSGYYKKWIEIARNVPDVMFWMPTRAWAADKYVAELKSRRPENMIVRPSPLYVDTDAPRVPYLDAGTSVCFHDVWNKHAQHNCPSIYPVKSNCEAQGCRKCWMKRTTTVNYEPHGEMTEKIREHIKRNPPASLDAMYSKYMHGGGPRSNPPPQNFAEWLAQNKVKLCSWSDEQWFDFLTSHGVEESRVGDWLEQTAEYD
jgi:hypothetical protein